MTTTISVQGAGHHVVVVITDEVEVNGEPAVHFSADIVPKGTTRNFYVHQTRDLSVYEVRDDETELNALIDAGDTAAAIALVLDE